MDTASAPCAMALHMFLAPMTFLLARTTFRQVSEFSTGWKPGGQRPWPMAGNTGPIIYNNNKLLLYWWGHYKILKTSIVCWLGSCSLNNNPGWKHCRTHSLPNDLSLWVTVFISRDIMTFFTRTSSSSSTVQLHDCSQNVDFFPNCNMQQFSSRVLLTRGQKRSKASK